MDNVLKMTNVQDGAVDKLMTAANISREESIEILKDIGFQVDPDKTVIIERVEQERARRGCLLRALQTKGWRIEGVYDGEFNEGRWGIKIFNDRDELEMQFACVPLWLHYVVQEYAWIQIEKYKKWKQCKGKVTFDSDTLLSIVPEDE